MKETIKKRRIIIPERYLNIAILYEDNHILVVKKPPGMLSQDNNKAEKGLQALMKKWLKEKYQKKGNVFLALVQRLDRNVGGLMVMAKTSKAASRLSESIRKRQLFKGYIAVVEGTQISEGHMVHYLRKNHQKKMAVVSYENKPDNQKSIMEISLLQKRAHFSLIEIILETGRFHQIRAQLGASGIPVWGDQKYGSKYPDSKNIALFCNQLAFVHPVNRKKMVFKEEVPKGRPWSLFSFRFEKKNQKEA